jgi:hypothetical protein
VNIEWLGKSGQCEIKEWSVSSSETGPHELNEEKVFDTDLSYSTEKGKELYGKYLESIEIETEPDPKEAAKAIIKSSINLKSLEDLEDLEDLEEKVWKSSAFMWRYMFDLDYDSPDS